MTAIRQTGRNFSTVAKAAYAIAANWRTHAGIDKFAVAVLAANYIINARDGLAMITLTISHYCFALRRFINTCVSYSSSPSYLGA